MVVRLSARQSQFGASIIDMDEHLPIPADIKALLESLLETLSIASERLTAHGLTHLELDVQAMRIEDALASC